MRSVSEIVRFELRLNLHNTSAALASHDSVRLAQVMGKLLDNAVKFTPAGGRVAVRLDVAGPDVVIEVRDSGAGIHPGFLVARSARCPQWR